MRGTQSCWLVLLASGGIIPAYAGNTSPSRLIHSSYGDHPRVCGEHLSATTLRHVKEGSSPRMRGTRHGWRADVYDVGIIPAYAGNTVGMLLEAALCEDHPRVCGEHSNRSGQSAV